MKMTARFGVSSLVLSGVLALGVTACGGDRLSGEAPSASPAGSATVSPVAANPSPAPATAAPASPAPAAPARPDPYQRGIERASSAYTIGQSAQSRDDWRLVASRWQQAIDLMANVPSSSPNHAQAQRKLSEYRRNLTYAQRQANLPITQDTGSVVIAPPQSSQATSVASANPAPGAANPSGSSAGNGSRRLFRAPIVRRAGGTPVINVMFNGNRSFEMIVDTGASGTLITQPMAAALGVVPVGQARVDTASANAVSFSLGYVRSVQVDGAIAQNLLVAVAGPSLDVGLLGHDFFGNYDVTIRQDVVEFRER